MTELTQLLNYELFAIGSYTLTPAKLMILISIFMGARLVSWLVGRFFNKFIFKKRKVGTGRQYVVLQFAKYIIYTLATLYALETFGITPNALLASGAALLVGIGLGLQPLFHDLISGFILLIEGTINVGDIITIDGTLAKVNRIDIRTCQIESRDGVTRLIPNSKLANDVVINWTYNEEPTRFQVTVGVAYHSDIEKVEALLLKATETHLKVLKQPAPSVFLQDFADSSLNFILHFYSEEYLNIEAVKSQLRYTILHLFRENGVEIPFPQQDLWLKNADDLYFNKAELNGKTTKLN